MLKNQKSKNRKNENPLIMIKMMIIKRVKIDFGKFCLGKMLGSC